MSKELLVGLNLLGLIMAPYIDDAKLQPQDNEATDKATVSFNPFYSNIPVVLDKEDYEHAKYLVCNVCSLSPPFIKASLLLQPTWPKVDWEPLSPFSHTDVGLRADPHKKALFSAAKNVEHLTPAIGTRLEGIDLRQLSDSQKDEL